MVTCRHILVAIKDPAARSQPALLKAAQLARASGATLELFHCLDTPVYASVPAAASSSVAAYEAEQRQKVSRRLERLADGLRRHSLKVSVAAEWDHPGYEAIVRRAVRRGADLVVAAQHAGSHRAAQLLRLTDWELLRLCPVPVLLVKNPRPWRHPAILVAIDPAHAYAKPQQLEPELLGAATFLRNNLRGTLHAVHAFTPVPPMFPDAMDGRSLQGLAATIEASAAADFRQALQATAIPAHRRHLIAQPPVAAISEAARRSRCSILVMGAVSRSGLRGLLIGNTAEQVLDAVGCDVLVVKPPGFRNRVPARPRTPRLLVSAA